MHSRHKNTLDAMFAIPLRSGIPWRNVEALFEALGVEVTEGSGSRVRVCLHGVRAVFHRPHLHKETDKGALRSVREFLLKAGVKP